VLHCFTGGREELELALQAGLYIGITGWVCDERPERGGDALAALLSLIPGDKLLIETDCPYLTPRSIGCAPCFQFTMTWNGNKGVAFQPYCSLRLSIYVQAQQIAA
jgi:Tat protein secretion system quality control protein TatD with DNase activity